LTNGWDCYEGAKGRTRWSWLVTAPLVVKFGGELLDDPSHLPTVVSAMSRVASGPAPLVIVHGGGKAIDRALKAAGIEKRQVDGLRITNEATLEAVVAVLAGTVNTRFVAALTTAGVRAVGLTGADGRCGLSEQAPPHRAVDGKLVELGRVGVPSDQADMKLLTTLITGRFVPIIACIGIDANGGLLNVNADTFAGHVAARLGASRLVIAGTTPGVLNERGETTQILGPEVIDRLIEGGTATAGMVAKLQASVHALTRGVNDVVIVDGRDRAALEAAAIGTAPASATRVVQAPVGRSAGT
jgi:acetylglutamate kinase